MDNALVLLILFVLAIAMLVGYLFYEKMNDLVVPKLNAKDPSGENYATAIFEKTDIALGTMDYIFVFILVGLILALVVSTVSINTHPVYFWVFLIVLIFMLVIAAQFSNVFYTLTGKEVFANASDKFQITSYVMDRYPYFILTIILIGIIVLYAKLRSDYY